MKTFINKTKQIALKLRHMFPSSLPQGGTEFDTWAKSIIDLYKPAGDERSIKFALCAMMMRLNPTEGYKSKFFFALCLRKAAAAQVAAYKMEEIKRAQAEAEKAAAEKAKNGEEVA